MLVVSYLLFWVCALEIEWQNRRGLNHSSGLWEQEVFELLHSALVSVLALLGGATAFCDCWIGEF